MRNMNYRLNFLESNFVFEISIFSFIPFFAILRLSHD